MLERIVISHVIKLYRSIQQIFDEYIPFTNLLGLLTVSESLRCKPQIWKKLAVTYHCIWMCRRGTVLCNMRSRSYTDKPSTKSVIVALEDLKESALGKMVFRRLYSTTMLPTSREIRRTTRNALPAYLALPPPPAEALPYPMLKNVPIIGTSGRRDPILPASPIIKPARALSAPFPSISQRIVSALVSFSSPTFAIWMRLATSLLPRLLEGFHLGEPLLQPGMERVRWKCVCMPVHQYTMWRDVLSS